MSFLSRLTVLSALFAGILMGIALGGSYVWGWLQPASSQLSSSQHAGGAPNAASDKVAHPQASIEAQPKRNHDDHQDWLTGLLSHIWDHLPDWFVAIFTAVLSFFTYRLWKSTEKLWAAGESQIAVARQSAEAAMLSAEAAIGIELPILRAEPSRFASGTSLNEDGSRTTYFFLYTLSITNGGRTKAFPTGIKCGWTLGTELPPEPVWRTDDPLELNLTVELAPAKTDLRLSDIRMAVPEVALEQLRGQKARFWFYVNLTYLDFMQTRHDVSFCWRLISTFGVGDFVADETPAYNRKTQRRRS